MHVIMQYELWLRNCNAFLQYVLQKKDNSQILIILNQCIYYNIYIMT